MRAEQIAAIVMVAAAASAAVLIAFLGAGVGGSSTTTTGTSTSTSTMSANGLQLRLALDRSEVGAGRNFTISVSLYNPLLASNNVSAGHNWAASGVSLGVCGTGGYPFGVAMFQGHDSAQNLSSAKQVVILPFQACPLALRFISGYLFQPQSVDAIILPSGSGATPTPMARSVTVSGQYSGQYSLTQKAQSLPSGAYTVVAADEWGNLAVLYIDVTAQPGMVH